MDFIVCSYMTGLTLTTTKPLLGEVLGIICWISVMILSFAILPGFLIYLVIMKPNVVDLRSDTHKNFWGVLYDDLRMDNRY